MTELTRRGTIGVVAAGLAAAAAPGGGGPVPAARAQLTSKTFVLVHGAFCGGWIWRRVSDLLERKGQKVFSPTLTGMGERSHLLNKNIDMDTHVTDIVNVVKWEALADFCLVAHSYGGYPASGAIEQIADRVSSIVWLDAFKPDSGQRVADVTNEAFRKLLQGAVDKGDAGFGPPPKLSPVFINDRDQPFVASKLSAQPVGTYLQPIKLSGARERVVKRTYIRIPKYPNADLDKAFADCKADKSWTTIELTDSGHLAMFDAPERVTDLLLRAA